jgi:spore coat polysaccharide biosynthesis protein SpsF (cytidylyltransferase family)
MRAIVIVQARMGSSRLPGKVLMNVAGKPILEQLLIRLRPSKKISTLIVATTTNQEDDAIESFCRTRGILFSRGSDWDVLDRFAKAAQHSGAKTGDCIVRICCDNPLHSWKVVDFVITQFQRYKVDYFSNSNQEPHFLEDGFDVEVVSYDALMLASNEATLLSEREHVMPFVKNSKRFKLGWRKANEAYRFKLSVDTENDLRLAERIFEELNDNPNFSIDEVVDLLNRKPELLLINKESEINSGYKKSIQEDRTVK